MMVCSTHTVKIPNLLTTLIVIRDVTWIYIYIYIYKSTTRFTFFIGDTIFT